MINFVQTRVYTVCSSKVCTVSLVYTKICKLNLNRVQTMINLIRMACAHSVNMVQTGFVQVPRQRRRRLPPKEAWLLVFRALVLTADFIRHSVGCVDMVLQRPTVTGSDIVISPVRHSSSGR